MNSQNPESGRTTSHSFECKKQFFGRPLSRAPLIKNVFLVTEVRQWSQPPIYHLRWGDLSSTTCVGGTSHLPPALGGPLISHLFAVPISNQCVRPTSHIPLPLTSHSGRLDIWDACNRGLEGGSVVHAQLGNPRMISDKFSQEKGVQPDPTWGLAFVVFRTMHWRVLQIVDCIPYWHYM